MNHRDRENPSAHHQTRSARTNFAGLGSLEVALHMYRRMAQLPALKRKCRLRSKSFRRLCLSAPDQPRSVLPVLSPRRRRVHAVWLVCRRGAGDEQHVSRNTPLPSRGSQGLRRRAGRQVPKGVDGDRRVESTRQCIVPHVLDHKDSTKKKLFFLWVGPGCGRRGAAATRARAWGGGGGVTPKQYSPSERGASTPVKKTPRVR